MRKRKEFYVLIRRRGVLAVNWADWGRSGVYSSSGYRPEPGDKILRVIEKPKRKASKRRSK